MTRPGRLLPPVLALALMSLPGAAGAAPKTTKAAAMRFEVATPKLKQELEVTRTGKKTVSFKLNLTGSCQRTVTGVARLKGGDLEMDEDEKGVAYPAEEFLHRGKDRCELFLRIKFKDATRAIVQQAEDCKTTCNPVEDLMLRSDASAAGPSRP